MYLDRFIGQTIDVAVKTKDKWTKLFTSYFDPYDYIICELIAVDEIGIWVKESADIVIVCDKAGDSIPKEKAIKETTTVGLLIK
ncbi:hypothetical protein KQI86_04055 [Clostridium sp. MSJ-11]|uniref:Uncharacterized protein n=1 Tax=Clostridium mobile TaxID=2841512 RepID=A0ABS6EG91_9CLOT|nr:hypothetical protein [Clostridium mobile]MBU5483490.1 hypothetical protein [Clostridium mobile]